MLTFHDAVEMFLIVTAEHLGAVLKDRDPFIKRFFEGLHPSSFPGGVELQGQYGIKRLNDLRNGFKHTAGFPGPVAIADAKADTAHFLEENTSRVFGLAFDDIDLAEVVQHDRIRAHLKAGRRRRGGGGSVPGGAAGLVGEVGRRLRGAVVERHHGFPGEDPGVQSVVTGFGGPGGGGEPGAGFPAAAQVV
ncbi:hypothetical protein [Streptomyces ipomoeae]|uniref:hypothetical protein n=1 Tax=Streptomyces ipomoeae TaxID=103232 RepID=UPI0011473561|nr:hypothetical protein [Streptomyces ipomoeae]MDX2936995.1 hypothetical protein [Streptomyces ipomoeae]TQE20112.1 hypothetical protein SipoB123_29435 [Streptomyces ipomoeae]